MKYTEKDIKVGTKLRCVSTIEPYWWKVGKQYEVEKSTDGLFIVKDEIGYIWNRWLILDFLNGKAHCKMEIVEEEKEMEKFAKITGYAGTGEKDKEVGLSIGSVYELVEYDPQGNSYIYLNEDTPRYYVADTQFTLVSKPPFKIGDKVRVLSNRSLATDENKLYYNDGDIAVVGEVHWLGVNESYGRVRLGTHKCGNWIDFNCIELVDEQQENPLVEMQQKVNNKIKLLKEERGRIIDKIERLDKHQRALKSKIDRLSDAEDALKILKDFK
jgi:hypothetical protein